MSCLALTIWTAALVIVVAGIFPLTGLLFRALLNARSIEGYLADMLEAGEKIAGHTGAIRALEDTRTATRAMNAAAAAIENKTGIVAGTLAGRAEEGAG